MTRRPPERSRLLRGGLVGLCALLTFSQLAEAQIGSGGGGRRGGGGIRMGDDPTDPEKKKEAARKRADEFLQAGLKLLEKGRIPEAKGKFKSVIELVGTVGAGQVAWDRLVGLHQEGMAKLEQAADLFEQKQFLDALKLARETKVLYANLFSGIPGTSHLPIVSQEAVLLIKQIENDPAAKEAIQEFEAARKLRKVERLEKKAEQTPAAWYDLHKALQNIVKHHPDCPTGRECAKRLRALQEDEKTAKIIKQEDDRRFIEAALRRIGRYESEGKSGMAKDERTKLAKRFPGKSLDELQRMAKRP